MPLRLLHTALTQAATTRCPAGCPGIATKDEACSVVCCVNTKCNLYFCGQCGLSLNGMPLALVALRQQPCVLTLVLCMRSAKEGAP